MANGTPGAPFGNHNAAKGRRWQQAIDRALEKRSKATGIEELDRLAEKFLDCVDSGAKDFMRGFDALGDRIDGRPTQALEHSGPGGGELPVAVSVVLTPPAALPKPEE